MMALCRIKRASYWRASASKFVTGVPSLFTACAPNLRSPMDLLQMRNAPSRLLSAPLPVNTYGRRAGHVIISRDYQRAREITDVHILTHASMLTAKRAQDGCAMAMAPPTQAQDTGGGERQWQETVGRKFGLDVDDALQKKRRVA